MLVKPEGAPAKHPAVSRQLPVHPIVLLGEGIKEVQPAAPPRAMYFHHVSQKG